jgi:hypothetical protein
VRVERVLAGKRASLSLGQGGLNRHEQRQVAALPVAADEDLAVYRLELHVRHPIAADDAKPLMQFGFGYAALAGDNLVMYRVQDHLRGMGLGRKGLVELVHKRKATLGLARLSARELVAFLAEFHEQADQGKLADFRAMVVSVNEEWSDGIAERDE